MYTCVCVMSQEKVKRKEGRQERRVDDRGRNREEESEKRQRGREVMKIIGRGREGKKKGKLEKREKGESNRREGRQGAARRVGFKHASNSQRLFFPSRITRGM